MKLDVGPNPTLVIENRNRLVPSSITKRLDDIWRAATLKRHSSLFNGVIFCAQTVEHNRIAVFQTEYKQYYAQISDSSLANDINLRPLACSGLLTCTDGIIVGKRSSTVTLDPNLWELAPAGTFDENCVRDGFLDAKTLLLNEANEELGIPKHMLQIGEVVAAFQEKKTQAIDLLVRAHLPITETEVLQYFEKSPCSEYSLIKVIKLSGINGFLQANHEALNPIITAGLAYLDI